MMLLSAFLASSLGQLLEINDCIVINLDDVLSGGAAHLADPCETHEGFIVDPFVVLNHIHLEDVSMLLILSSELLQILLPTGTVQEDGEDRGDGLELVPDPGPKGSVGGDGGDYHHILVLACFPWFDQ